jgi:RNA polymerase sigma factor (sigma-70 family)
VRFVISLSNFNKFGGNHHPWVPSKVQNIEKIEQDKLRELVSGCVRNDRKCQQQVYKMFYSKMMGVCLRYASDSDQAKDILQDGFIKVFGNLPKYSFEGSFEGWVRRIMVNTAIDYFRKSRTSNVLLMPDENDMERLQQDTEEDDDFELEVEEVVEYNMDDVVNAMQQLSPAYRAVFNLFVVESMSHQDISESLGISIGTSKSNFAKAKKNIRKILLTTRKQKQ